MAIPRNAVTALDMRYLALDEDDNETDLTEYYQAFNFDHGARSSRLSPPASFTSRGELHIQNIDGDLNYSTLEQLVRLQVKSAAYTYFDLAIRDIDVRSAQERAILHLTGHGGAEADTPFSVVINPTPGGNVGTIDRELPKGTPIKTSYLTNAPLWGLMAAGHVETAGSGPQRILQFSGSTFRRDFENWASCLMLERCNTNKADYLALPMPISTRDRRTASHIYRSSNSNMVKRGYSEGRTDKWQADAWQVGTQSAPWQIRSLQNEGRGGSRLPTYLIVAFSYSRWDRRPRPLRVSFDDLFVRYKYDSDGLEPNEFGGFIDVQYFSVVGWSNRDRGSQRVQSASVNVSADRQALEFTLVLNPSYVASNSRVSFVVRLQCRYYKSRNVVFGTELIKARGEPEKRQLRTGQFNALMGHDDITTKYPQLLDAWDDWYGKWAQIALIPASLDEGMAQSIVQKRPGDIVNISVGELDDRCLLIRSHWNMRGIQPLVVTWTVVSIAPRAQAAPIQPPYVLLNGERVALNDEEIIL